MPKVKWTFELSTSFYVGAGTLAGLGLGMGVGVFSLIHAGFLLGLCCYPALFSQRQRPAYLVECWRCGATDEADLEEARP